jgi:16S rRNA (cytosine1402-N4)-methyltransferase
MAHTPVLLNEVLTALQPAPGERMVDATFGRGGYTRAITARGAQVLSIDQDPDVIARGTDIDGAELAQGRFGDIAELAAAHGFDAADGVVFDIGVSSMQLDEAERGFSFMHDGPLDMRMRREGISAADVVNTYAEEEIANIIFTLGEEPKSRHIARAIIKARAENKITRTAQLAEIVGKVARAKPGMNPATRTFQALRIYVNQELEQLREGLNGAVKILKTNGRLAVVTFHSLEDRIVKEFFDEHSGKEKGASRHLPTTVDIYKKQPPLTITSRKAITPTAAECTANPRARSAKLRVAIRNHNPFQEPSEIAA